MHEREHIATAVRGAAAASARARRTVEEHTRKLTVPVTGGAKLLAEVIRELDTRGIEIDDIGLRRPTLDDVFISLTGHAAEAEDEENGAERDAGPQGRREAGADAGQDEARKEAAK